MDEMVGSPAAGSVEEAARPLEGCAVLVPRSASQKPELAEKLSALGAHAIDYPCMRVSPIRPNQELDRAIEGISGYAAVVFLSPEGVDAFMERVDELRAFSGVKFVVHNLQTAAKLAQYKVIADVVADDSAPEQLARAAVGAAEGKKLLLCSSARTVEAVPEAFRAEGLEFDDIPVCYSEYRNERARDIARAMAEGELRLCVLAGAQLARAVAGTLPRSALSGVTAVCSGERTAVMAVKCGMQTAIADKPTFSAVVDALKRAYTKKL